MEIKGERKRVYTPGDPGVAMGRLTPLLVDAIQGARMLSVSPSHFYKFMRKRGSAPPIAIGSLNMWRRSDLLRIIGSPCGTEPPEDILIDAMTVAELCSVSRSLVYKLHCLGMMPAAVLHGRTLRWGLREIVEWVEARCPPRRRTVRKRRGGKA
jgi:predicted DNA-binding transcriptional regulator AlpA